ncbi:MAG: leucyl/phenylalanyl-tRNA--protein transferase [Casimicrobiaceae bacterium]
MPFPPAEAALEQPNGLLCAGLELTPERVLEAYRGGIFPWFNEGQPVLWWNPDPRMVLFPEEFRLHRSLRKTLRRGGYVVTCDQAFDRVMQGCAEPRPDQDGTWITDEMRAVYGELHRRGVAHSVETWVEGELVGGLYGLALGRVFYGESMFARVTDASKIAFAHLVAQLSRWEFGLIDCQQETAHLASFGARPIARAAFLEHLNRLLHSEPDFTCMEAACSARRRWCFDPDLAAAWA